MSGLRMIPGHRPPAEALGSNLPARWAGWMADFQIRACIMVASTQRSSSAYRRADAVESTGSMWIEKLFEKLLWHSRLVVLVPVAASLVVSIGMFYVSTVDVGTLVGHILHYHDSTG